MDSPLDEFHGGNGLQAVGQAGTAAAYAFIGMEMAASFGGIRQYIAPFRMETLPFNHLGPTGVDRSGTALS